jgi:heme/copper-type cytochrome/quinol oxidase subunit 2
MSFTRSKLFPCAFARTQFRNADSLWFKPLKEGRYQINCAQLCGAGHYSMSAGMLTVESQEKFDKWQAEQSKTPSGGSFE